MTTRVRTGIQALTAAVLSSGLLFSSVASADYSSANRLLFMTDHLAEVSEPGDTLQYRFTREGSWDDSFEDRIQVRITDVEDGRRTAEVDVFESEDRHRPMAPVHGAQGNPALLAFLQLDVGEMGRQTDTPWQAYQAQIRGVFAFAEAESTTVEYNGEEVDAQAVRIVPFANADQGSPAGQGEGRIYQEKRYEFILSEHVPGYIYQIQTTLPDPEDEDAEPLMVDTMRLTQVDR